MKYHAVLDLHTHTLASGHAYSTVREMAKAASLRGLELLGITEHAPAMPGTCHEMYFRNLKIMPREMEGIRCLFGSEVNILDPDGNIDLPEDVLVRLDLVIASLHMPGMKPGTMEENTKAYLNVMKNPYVNIIGHPDDGRYPLDHRALAEAAAEHGKVLEVNNHSLHPKCVRQNARENYLSILEWCKQFKVPVVMGTDAHFDTYVGIFDNARALLEEVDFPEELVLNRSLAAIAPYLNKGLEDF